jgi:dolichol-phosphate mannosyltransferase
MKISVALIVFNEGDTLQDTLVRGYAALESTGLDFELWVFDNCSSDNTPQVMELLLPKLPRLRFHRQPSNLGYAGSSATTWSVPQADYYSIVDGDGQYDLSDVKKAFAVLLDGNHDIVFGYRVKREDPFSRVVMSKIFNWVSRFLLRSPLNDMNCGFRIMTAATAKKINITHKLNFVGPEIYTRSIQNRLRCVEVKVQHFPRRGGVSVYSTPMKTLRSVIQMLKYLLILRNDLKTASKKLEQAEMPRV